MYSMIPIVMGGAIAEINVEDYKSPKELADYLHFLDNNDSEFKAYFEWRKYFNLYSGHGMCQLCEKLHDSDSPAKIYCDVDDWFVKGACTDGHDFIRDKISQL